MAAAEEADCKLQSI